MQSAVGTPIIACTIRVLMHVSALGLNVFETLSEDEYLGVKQMWMDKLS